MPRWPPGRRFLLTGGAHASVDTPRVRGASSRPHHTSSGFIGNSRTGPGAGTSTSSRSMGCDSRSSGRRSRRLGGRDRRCPHARPSPAARRGARGYGNSTTNTRLLPTCAGLPTGARIPVAHGRAARGAIERRGAHPGLGRPARVPPVPGQHRAGVLPRAPATTRLSARVGWMRCGRGMTMSWATHATISIDRWPSRSLAVRTNAPGVGASRWQGRQPHEAPVLPCTRAIVSTVGQLPSLTRWPQAPTRARTMWAAGT